VERVTTEGGPHYIPPPERVATFDNDGTLWCEKPMPIELGFILQRLSEMADADGSLRLTALGPFGRPPGDRAGTRRYPMPSQHRATPGQPPPHRTTRS
jgi:hypothetical protein